MTAQPKNGHSHDEAHGLEAAAEASRKMCEPAMKAMACSSAELMSLASRRAQAYVELPARIGACRSPQELLAEQARFAHTAWQHYSECCGRMLSAYQALAPQSAGMLEIWQSAITVPGAMMPRRDHSESGRDEARDSDDRRGSHSRRAA